MKERESAPTLATFPTSTSLTILLCSALGFCPCMDQAFRPPATARTMHHRLARAAATQAVRFSRSRICHLSRCSDSSACRYRQRGDGGVPVVVVRAVAKGGMCYVQRLVGLGNEVFVARE